MIKPQAIMATLVMLGAITLFGVGWELQRKTGFNALHMEWWTWLVKYRYSQGVFPPEIITAIRSSLPLWALVSGFIGLVILFIASKRKTDYGAARFARKKDLKGMALNASTGVVLGVAFNKLLSYDTWLSACVFAAPGSGKSEGVIKPSIFNAGSERSIVVHDLAGELFNETAGHRATLGPVFRLSWGSSDTAHWNPLDQSNLPRDSADLQTYVDRIWHLLVPHSQGHNSHFDERGRQLGIACTLFLVLEAREKGASATFEEVFYWLAEGTAEETGADVKDPAGLFLTERAVVAVHKGWPRVISGTFQSMANTNQRERSSIISSMERAMGLWQNEHVCKATSRSDFSVRDFRGLNGKPISVYIAIPDKDVETFSSITRIFLAILSAELNSITKEDVATQLGVTFLLDEAPRMGNMPVVVLQGPALGRKCKVNYITIAQDPGQLKAVYGPDGLSTINTVYQYKVVYHQINADVQKELAGLVGQETRVRKSISLNKSNMQAGGSRSLEGQYLVRPEEFGAIAQFHSLIFAPHHYSTPLKAKGAFSPKIGKFRNFVKIAPPISSVTDHLS
jgi:type IV secretion system protein VirD4